MIINRNGLTFVDNKSLTTYLGSGLRFASYYKKVCVRCGFSFAGPRWKRHDHAECDQVLAECAKDRFATRHSARNLFGGLHDHR